MCCSVHLFQLGRISYFFFLSVDVIFHTDSFGSAILPVVWIIAAKIKSMFVFLS